MKSLDEMMHEVHTNNVDKGWFEKERTFGDGIALMHAEVSEALEAYRDRGLDHYTQPSKEGQTIGKPNDVPSEFADVLIRLLDECYRHGYDLEEEYERKMAYNRTRPHLHGGKAL